MPRTLIMKHDVLDGLKQIVRCDSLCPLARRHTGPVLLNTHQSKSVLRFSENQHNLFQSQYSQRHPTVYPNKYAHVFVVLCFVVVMQSFIMNSHEVFIHINQGCFAGTGAIVRLPQCQWSKTDGYGKISQCITTTKHSKAKTVCIFLGIYCTIHSSVKLRTHFVLVIKYISLAFYCSNQLPQFISRRSLTLS